MITIATRLGMIACRYLVTGFNEKRYISAPEIAEFYNMNVRALMPALRQLTRVGILHSRIGGCNPGFIFSRNPKEVTLFQVLVALEGYIRFPCCRELVPSLNCGCHSKEVCETFLLMDEVIESVTAKLNSISMADYARRYNSK